MRRYAITNRVPGVGDDVEAVPSDSGVTALLADLRLWAREGVEYVQLREKDLPNEDLRQLLRAVLRARDRGLEDRAVTPVNVGEEGTRVLVSTSVEVAVAEGADGVHLTGSWALSEAGRAELGARVAAIRRRFGAAGRPEPTVSISCHTVGEVRTATAAGVDLLLFGPVFGKVVGGHLVREGVGLAGLRSACEAAEGVPLYALGGVTWANAGQCLAAGAAGMAGIRLFGRTMHTEADPARPSDAVTGLPEESHVRK